MTGPGYIDFLESNAFVSTCRFKAIQWFIHSQRRFNFCMGTVFKAVNYVDRFIETNQCNGWSYWMMELLSLASLSIAIKFGETCPPSLHEIQDGLESCFEASLIQKMELKILRSLGWELNSITPHSYVELITWELSSVMRPFVVDNLSSRLNDVLLASSLDVKSLVYRPSVVAMSGLKCVLEDEECLSYITTFIPQDQQLENLQSCYELMQEILVRCRKQPDANGNPSSPDTVLIKEQVAIYEEQVDLSFIDGPNTLMLLTNGLKRKRGEDGHDHCVTKFNKCVN
uniref:putative cyclin-D7-1 n=1 Tax=Erigeron canadensis TaxID=72917 RepID=UPI001CB8A99A|nr:putative cyclin-D7-1 [Erigeron canadensis]